MDLQDGIIIIKEDFPSQAIEIVECLELLLDSMDSTIKDISKRTAESMENRNFTKIKTYGELVEMIHFYESHIQQIKEDLEIEDKETNDETGRNINYDAYLVDNNIPHTLYENFTFKKPFAFELDEVKIKVNTWKDLLIETCEVYYGVLTTGFDAPSTEYIVICRPTTSEVLYEQIIGRGLRGPAFGGTEECTIIDFSDNINHLGKPLAYLRFADFWMSHTEEDAENYRRSRCLDINRATINV